MPIIIYIKKTKPKRLNKKKVSGNDICKKTINLFIINDKTNTTKNK